MSNERRKYMRFYSFLDGTFYEKEENINGLIWANDFSRGGFNATLNRLVKPGKILELDMRFHDSIMPFFATGRVIWIKEKTKDLSSEFDVGIKLEKIDPIDRQRIIDYCYYNWHKSKKVKEKNF